MGVEFPIKWVETLLKHMLAVAAPGVDHQQCKSQVQDLIFMLHSTIIKYIANLWGTSHAKFTIIVNTPHNTTIHVNHFEKHVKTCSDSSYSIHYTLRSLPLQISYIWHDLIGHGRDLIGIDRT